MTENSYTKLSTHGRKLTRDISFATAVGRESPFDPFQERNVCKLMGKQEPSSTLLYFAQKPMKRSPVVVNMSKDSDRPPMSIAKPVLCDVMYDVPLKSQAKDVTFPKATRFSPGIGLNGEKLPNADEREKQRASSAHPPKGASPALNNASRGNTPVGPSPPRMAERPASQASTVRPRSTPNIGLCTGRDGKAHRPSSRAASCEPSSSSTKRAANFRLPWEKAPPKASSATNQQDGGGSGSSPRQPASVIAQQEGNNSNASGAGIHNVENAHNTATSATDRYTDDVMDASRAEERWNYKRNQFLARFGMLGAAANRDRSRKDEVKGPSLDPAKMPGREKKMGFHHPEKEIHDISYSPNDAVTTKTRSTPRAEIGRLASREDLRQRRPYIGTTENLLNPDNLRRLHERMCEQSRRKNFGLPDHFAQQQQQQQQNAKNDEGTPTSAEAIFNLNGPPLSAADDMNCDTSAQRPPNQVRTRVLRGVPDLGLTADREDEPLAAILGGDPAPYRRHAKKLIESIQAKQPNKKGLGYI